MGFEGANVLFDTWVHPLVMGLEEHLLTMFRDDFEFSDASGASHLGHGGTARPYRHAELVSASAASQAASPAEEATPEHAPRDGGIEGGWTAEAEKELLKIPFFVRGKARRNTERYATERGVAPITLDTLYDAKAHYAR